VERLAATLGVPRLALFAEVESTMDEAHRLAADGAPAGTLVVADAQRAGRGRGGRQWVALPGAGVWCTLIERPNDAAALDVLSLRVGLRAAAALDRFAGDALSLKWPNDLYLHARKVGGILVESRWRDGRPDWASIGIGVNIVPPAGLPSAAALGARVSRVEMLAELVPALRAAASARGHLSEAELSEFARRDIAAGRVCLAPRAGRVAGIAADGALLVVCADGIQRCREGSLVLEGDPP
jgi:BirA family transcriptional regulator, biotin operon repressor / biotin---[acetyl-CoA-carboxylase] ligase